MIHGGALWELPFCLFRANPAEQLAKHLRYTIILIGALLIIAYLLYFLRHKRSNKYRDLLVLVALVELLTIGIQFAIFRLVERPMLIPKPLPPCYAAWQPKACRYPPALCQQQYCSQPAC